MQKGAHNEREQQKMENKFMKRPSGKNSDLA